MRSKMNDGQKRVSKEIRAFCKLHAHETQFKFKLCLTGYVDYYNRTLALCESGIVTVWVGAIIEPWREFPTATLKKLLNGAKRELAKKNKANPPKVEPKVEVESPKTKVPSGTTWGTSNFVSKKAAFNYYKLYDCDAKEVNRKIRDGEISIGVPVVKEGRLILNDEGRYLIAV